MYDRSNYEELSLLEEFINNGDLKKALTNKQWQDWINFHRTARDEKQPQEVRQRAQANIKAMEEGKIISNKKKNIPTTHDESLENLTNIAEPKKNKFTPKKATFVASKLQAPTDIPAAVKSKVHNAVALVQDLHQKGLKDDAHRVLNAIPAQHLDQVAKNYNTAFMHYGITPGHWNALDNAGKQHVNDLHSEVLDGLHDNNPDFKEILPKVKPTTPKIGA
jgi:hypothetical protein